MTVSSSSTILLFQYPMAVAWTFAAPQSVECWDFCTYMLYYPVLGIPSLYGILMLCHSLHDPSCHSDVCELAVTAGCFVNNISLLLHWDPLLHLHQKRQSTIACTFCWSESHSDYHHPTQWTCMLIYLIMSVTPPPTPQRLHRDITHTFTLIHFHTCPSMRHPIPHLYEHASHCILQSFI